MHQRTTSIGESMKKFITQLKNVKVIALSLSIFALTVVPSNFSSAVTSANPAAANGKAITALPTLPATATSKSVLMSTTVDPYTPTTSTPDYFGTIDPTSGYATGNFANSPLPISVVIQGDGVGAFYLAESDWTAVPKGTGQITRFIPVNQGSGYVAGTTFVSVIGGGGSGAQGTAHIDSATGAITSIDVFKPGFGYGSVSGIRKFTQDVPDLQPAIATPKAALGIKGTPGYIPASDSYEIATIRSKWKFSQDLPYTTVNMYVQIDPACAPSSVKLTYPSGARIYNLAGNQVCAFPTNQDANTKAVAPFSYLGPTIVATKDKPVRVTFDNYLPTGFNDCTSAGGIITNAPGQGTCGGDLFLPVDNTIMGAGAGPDGGFYSTNRSEIHLHGGVTPWISDGTPDQWVTPVGANEQYPAGVSVRYVPDMWYDAQGREITSCYGSISCATPGASNNPGRGRMTFYYTNQQSARMMFYHDHSSGTTRLNVYSGEIAGFLLHDQEEGKLMVAAGVRPASAPNTTNPDQEKVYVIQDKTFVPSTPQLLLQDPTWNQSAWGGTGNLWYPHVYQPNQNPALLPTSAVVTTATVASGGAAGSTTVTVAAANSGIKIGQVVAGSGLTKGTTVVGVNGKVVTFTPAAAAQLNGKLSFGNAASDSAGATQTGRWDYGPWFWPASTATLMGPVHNPLCNPTCPGNEYINNPGVPNVSAVPEIFADVMMVNGITYPVAHFKPQVYRLQLLNASNDRSLTLNLYYAKSSSLNPDSHCTGNLWANNATSITPLCGDAGEVSMVPAVANTPATQGLVAPDQIQDKAAGVPDMRLAGPTLVEYASEGGILPDLNNIATTPLGMDYNRQSITTTNVKQHGLLLGPAQRAEVFVDLSNVPAGSTLILYNDAPAPYPGFDPRFDYYTGDADQSLFGGAPTTLPGYAPNTRTIMQIQVDGTAGNGLDLAAVSDALHADYKASQEAPIVPQVAYNAALGTNTPTDTFPGFSDSSLVVPSTGVASIAVDPNTVKKGAHSGVPTVSIAGGNGNGARAIAKVAPAGSIADVSVTNPVGTTYDSSNMSGIQVVVDAPTGANPRPAVIVPSIAGSDSLSGVLPSTLGSGYTSAPVVTVQGAATRPAVVQAQLAPTSIATIQVAAAGIYTTTPNVTISGGGSTQVQSAKANLAPTPIATIDVVDGGSYTAAPTLHISAGVTNATATAILSGYLAGVTVTSPGVCSVPGTSPLDPNINYFGISFSGAGQVTPATAEANINDVIAGGAHIVTLRSISLLTPGSYSSAPSVSIQFHGINCSQTPVAVAQMSANSHISSVIVNGTGSFTSTPTVTADSGAAVFSVTLQPTKIDSISLVGSLVSDFTDAPIVTFDSGVASATAYLNPSPVASYLVTDPGAGYSTPPIIVVDAPTPVTGIPGMPAGIQLVTATAAPAAASGALQLTVVDGGSGYTTTPNISITGALTGSDATATAVLGDGYVHRIDVMSSGAGYLSAPAVTLTYSNGYVDSTSATATLASKNITFAFQSKGVQEAFEIMYGRMNAMFNSEIPATTWVNQTSVTWASSDSPTEIVNTNTPDALAAAGGTAVDTLPDGTQIWRFTHNGVDTHFLHFHMFNVQVVARLQWDGVNQTLNPGELGWRDTVSIDQLTILFVAIKPIVPQVPWSLPNSIRPLSPSEVLGMPGMMMSAADPLNNTVTQNNQLVNFGWEYMIHCHLLDHEENDMMRSIAVGVVLNAPTGTTLTVAAGTRANTKNVTVSFVDQSNNETGFSLERRVSGTATWRSVGTLARHAPVWNSGPGRALIPGTAIQTAEQSVTDYGLSVGTTGQIVDRNVPTGVTYEYRVVATDLIGTPLLGAFPSDTIKSDPSNTAYAKL